MCAADLRKAFDRGELSGGAEQAKEMLDICRTLADLPEVVIAEPFLWQKMVIVNNGEDLDPSSGLVLDTFGV